MLNYDDDNDDDSLLCVYPKVGSQVVVSKFTALMSPETFCRVITYNIDLHALCKQWCTSAFFFLFQKSKKGLISHIL